MLQASENDAASRGGVADRIESAIVRNDFEDVPGLRLPEPAPRSYRDPEIAPITNAARRRAMDELCSKSAETAPELLSNRSPITHGDQLRLACAAVDGERIEHRDQRVFAARILDVDEHAMPWSAWWWRLDLCASRFLCSRTRGGPFLGFGSRLLRRHAALMTGNGRFGQPGGQPPGR
jgi:hypothetical protein